LGDAKKAEPKNDGPYHRGEKMPQLKMPDLCSLEFEALGNAGPCKQ